MFTPYRNLFKHPVGIGFSVAGFIARLPISMTLLAVTYVIIAKTGSYTTAGFVAMGASLMTTIFSPMWSRAADQQGQRKLLTRNTPLHIGLGLAFLFAIDHHYSKYIWIPLILFAEIFIVNVGGMIRRRWLYALGDDRKLINVAYSYEALMDEIIFIFGPVVTTVAATAIDPSAGIYFAFGFMAIGTVLLLRSRSSEPPAYKRDRSVKHEAVLKLKALQAICVPYIFLGAFFQSMNLIVIGFDNERDATNWTGLVLAIWAAGSGVAALVHGSIHWKISDALKFRRLLALLILFTIPVIFVNSVTLLAVALFASGLLVAPILITGYAIAEKAVPSEKVTETLAWVIAALNLGGALPGPLTGHLIDAFDARTAFIVPLACLFLANFTTLPYRKTWRAHQSISRRDSDSGADTEKAL